MFAPLEKLGIRENPPFYRSSESIRSYLGTECQGHWYQKRTMEAVCVRRLPEFKRACGLTRTNGWAESRLNRPDCDDERR